MTLARKLAPPNNYELADVYYFSAYATWLPAPFARHRQYIRALKATGVEPVLGKFKTKPRHCRNCGATGKQHEEKETDVNIALHLLRDAYENRFDAAFVISADSDLVPAIKMVKLHFPKKRLVVITPCNLLPSRELQAAAGGGNLHRVITYDDLSAALLPEVIAMPDGKAVATRPAEYKPPQ